MVIVIIIGKHWIDIEENGQRRLIRPNDPVRIEIETALARKDNVLILPLFVQGAQMPRVGRGQLPASIAELSYINGVEVRSDPYFHDDMDRVITIISDFLGHPTPRKVATPPSPQASEPANSPHAQPLLSSAYQMAEAQPAISAPQSPMNRPPDRVVGMSFNDAPTLATRSVGSYPYPYMPSSLTQAAPRNDSTAFKVITFGSGFSALAFLASFIVLAATSLNTAPSAVAAFLAFLALIGAVGFLIFALIIAAQRKEWGWFNIILFGSIASTIVLFPGLGAALYGLISWAKNKR